jgi:tetratricopeptide (TPR) repeat protein
MVEPDRDSNALVASALSALRAGNLLQAEEICDQLREFAPLEPAVHQLVATIALQRGRFEEAMRWACSCLELRPDHPPALILAGRAARGAGDLGQSEIWFQRASDLSPNRPEAAFLHCLVLLEQRDPSALALLERLLRDFPNYAAGWSEVGAALRKLGQLEAAAVAFARAAKGSDEPSHPARLGEVLKLLGRSREAVAAFRSAVKMAPDRVDLRMALAACLREGGEIQLARHELEHAVSIEPGDSRHWFALGLVCEDLRDLAGAIFAYRRSTALDPSFPEAHVNLGLNLQKSGEFEAAMVSYRQAVRLRSDTFGRVAQALASARKGRIWLNLSLLRRSLSA